MGNSGLLAQFSCSAFVVLLCERLCCLRGSSLQREGFGDVCTLRLPCLLFPPIRRTMLHCARSGLTLTSFSGTTTVTLRWKCIYISRHVVLTVGQKCENCTVLITLVTDTDCVQRTEEWGRPCPQLNGSNRSQGDCMLVKGVGV